MSRVYETMIRDLVRGNEEAHTYSQDVIGQSNGCATDIYSQLANFHQDADMGARAVQTWKWRQLIPSPIAPAGNGSAMETRMAE